MFASEWSTFGVYYLWVLLLSLTLIGGWIATLLSLPGNWVIAGAAALFAWQIEPPDGIGISWRTVIILLLVAGLGEVIETVAGAAGTAKHGGSRRSMLLSVIGAVVGSIGGVVIGLPLPIIGPAIAAVMGGAMGAFGGAALGEHWKGRPMDQQLTIGRAAFMGRILGTVGKLAAGAIMVVIALADALLV
jgi:uncharacterized protein YqgC (DUF456 family)